MTRLLAILVLLCAEVSAEAQTTYYIDYVGGNDSNNGLSTSTAWQHDPFMVGFTGSYSHVPGDRYIFKGGVTWPYSCFVLAITAGGTANIQDYYGTNAAWYSGSAWSPPIWDCQMAGANGTTGALNISQMNGHMISLTANYVTLDSIVVTNLNWSGTSAMRGVDYNSSLGVILTNMQFLCYSNLTGGSGSDVLNVVQCIGAAGQPTNEVTHCTFTCLPNTAWCGQACYYGTTVDHCIMHDMPNFVVGLFLNVSNNFL